MKKWIRTTVKEKIGYLILNRPEKRNALDEDMVAGISAALDQYREDKEVKVVVIKAEGEVFCSGADLAYIQKMQDYSYEENLADSHQLKALYRRIYEYPKVIIAQIQGHALAGGCGLASVCDFSFAVPKAEFGYPEVKIGFVPALVSVFLIRKIGEAKTRELLLTGDAIPADEACRIGLINRVTEADMLEKEVVQFAGHLVLHNSGQSMETTKKLIGDIQDFGMGDALEHAAVINVKARASEDCKRGITAFLNKKPIRW